jgi:hypothetical protein
MQGTVGRLGELPPGAEGSERVVARGEELGINSSGRKGTMKPRARRGIEALIIALVVVVSGCGDDGGDGASPTPTQVPTLAATPTATVAQGLPSRTPTRTGTPVEEAVVQGLVVLRQDVTAGKDDAVGAPPEAWGQNPDSASFDRALSHADWTVTGEQPLQGVTGSDGQFEIKGLEAGQYFLDLTRTLDGNLISARVPFAVGPDGAAEVTAEVSWGLVRAVSVYSNDGVVFREVFGANGAHLVTADGKIVEIGTPGRVLLDENGDGQFDAGSCVDQVWSCEADRDCGEDHVCQCVASCPTCEDCGPAVCVLPSEIPPYRCGEDGACAQPGDRCVCVSSCPDCDDCQRTVCVPSCAPVDIVQIDVGGPSQLVAGQAGSLFATARLSDGTAIDVTYLVDWRSSAIEVATVDSWGSLTAVAAGACEVTASLGNVTSSPWRIEVMARPPITRIYVQNASCYYYDMPVRDGGPVVTLPAPAEKGDMLPVPQCGQVVRIGGMLRFSAVAEFGGGLYYEDVTDRADWQVTPPAVGTVAAGVFTGVAEGTAQLTASLDGVSSDPTEVRVVTEATVVNLSIYTANWGYPAVDGGPISAGSDVACWECGWFLTVLIDDELQFGATAQYDTGEWEDVTGRVTWRSSASTVATIASGGLMAAVGEGEAKIDAVLGEVTSNPVDVRVVAEATLQSISAYPEGTDRVLSSGDDMYFRATGYYDVGLSRDVTEEANWHSSNASVAGFDKPGVLTGRAAGSVEVWAELGGVRSESYTIEVYATSELDYCDPVNINRDVWSDEFNRVVLESDCAWYSQPALVTLRYTVTETQPHGGIFDPCLDLYVYSGGQRIRTLREEGCGEPFMAAGAPEYDREALKYQLRAFWDLKDGQGQPVPPGDYTVYGRFYLYYDPVVSVAVRVLGPNETPAPVTRRPTPTPTPWNVDVVRLQIGSASVQPGGVAEIDVVLDAAGAAVAGVQNDIGISPELLAGADGSRPDCKVNPAINKSGTSFSFLPSGIRAIVIALDNTDPIPDGSVLYTCKFSIPDGAAGGVYPLVCSTAGASDPLGRSLAVECSGGMIKVGGEITVVTPTPTPKAWPVCTPPLCGPGEVYACPGSCPNGCGTVCSLPTPTWPPVTTNMEGEWSINVPQLGLTCPAVISQNGEVLDINVECGGMNATLGGFVDAGGSLRAKGMLLPQCPTVDMIAQVAAADGALSGTLACESLLLEFSATRGAPVPAFTPTPTPTEIPAGTPGDLNLTGEWFTSVPDLGYTCMVDLQQSGSSLVASSLCYGYQVTVSGHINEKGEFSLSGSLPMLCPDARIRGFANEGGSYLSGTLACDGMELEFEAEQVV